MKKINKQSQISTREDNEIKEAVLKFGLEIGASVQALGRASKIYAEVVAKFGPKAEAAFKAAYSNVSEPTWEKMRLIGNGDLMPQALLLSGTIASRVMRMKKKEQEDFMRNDNGVEVFNEQTRKPEFVKYVDLAPRHARILFDEAGHVRTLSQQRAFVEREPSKPRNEKTVAYFIEGDVLVVNRKCRIGKNELAGILRRMA